MRAEIAPYPSKRPEIAVPGVAQSGHDVGFIIQAVIDCAGVNWNVRMRATHLLQAGADNACSVAYRIGFNSEAAFSRAFRKEFGMPPSAWRRKSCAGAYSAM